MKVLLVCEKHTGGGTETAFISQSELLSHHGHQVIHFSLSSKDAVTQGCPNPHYTAHPNIKGLVSSWKHYPLKFLKHLFYLLPCRSLLNRVACYRFKRCLQEVQPDLVIFHSIDQFLTPSMLKLPAALNIPSILTVHTAWMVCPSGQLLQKTVPEPRRYIPNLYSRLDTNHHFHRLLRDKTLFQALDVITAPSRALVQLIQQAGVTSTKKIQLSYNTLPSTMLALQPDFHSSTPPQRFFLAVGRFAEGKGFFELVQAFAQLPDIPLVIVGDGAERPLLEHYIAKHQLTHIQCVGWQDHPQLDHYYQHCYATIVPSLCFEALGYTVLESFAHGKPVIGSNSGGIAQSVIHGESGLLFNPGDMTTLQHHVRYLWNTPEQALAMGKSGYHMVQHTYHPTHVYQHLSRIMTQALTQKSEPNAAPIQTC